MRVLLCVVLVCLTIGVLAPTAQADTSTETSTSDDTTTSSDSTTSSGPDPSTCRPYCLAA